LIAGESDPVAPVATAETLKDRIGGAELEILPGIGHWMTIEMPGRSADALTRHLDGARP